MTQQNWQTHLEDLKQALAQKDRFAANDAVRALLDAKAPIGPQWRQICELMRVSGEWTLAHRAMDAFCLAAGNSPQARYSKVVLHTQAGQMQAAFDLLRTLPADVPEPYGHAYVLGNMAVTLGKFDLAREQLALSLRHRPGWGPCWLSLAAIVNLATDPLGEQLLAEAKAAEQQGAGDKARYFYAVGKLYADRGEHDAAFAAFDKGAKLLRSEMRYSRDGNQANALAAMSGWDDRLIEEVGGSIRQATDRPIFVTGLPRSGTTLVEQIIASHSSVADGAELNLLPHLAVAAGGVAGADLRAYRDAGGDPNQLTRTYLHLLSERCGTHGRIVDKTIDASRFIGLVAAVLPDAPLIWMRRDPMDNAWSCLRTFFIHGVAWSYSLTDIAHHFRLEDMLAEYWSKRLGDRLLMVPYGDLVDQPAEWTARIIRHCGLAEEAAVFAPHETNRVVATASAMQVRRPINRDGMGVAAPYVGHMSAFSEAYTGN